MSWHNFWIAVKGFGGYVGNGIAKGSLGKVGADFNDFVLSILNIPRNKNTDNSDNENKFYCPFCDEAIDIDRRRTMCLGIKCNAEVVYGATQQEREQAANSGVQLGFYTFFILFGFAYWVYYNLSINIRLEFQWWTLYLFSFLCLAITEVIAFFSVHHVKNKYRKRQPRCFKYTIATNRIEYRYVEKQVNKIKQDV